MDIHDIIWEAELAEVIGLSVAALRKGRTKGYGPAAFRMGRRVGYAKTDVAEFLLSLRGVSSHGE